MFQTPNGETSMMKRFLKDESGATAIEYGLIAALIGIVLVTVLSMVGESLTETFTLIDEALTPKIK